MKLEQLGPLQAVYIKGRPEKPCLVLCHGYGADAFDLASLADVFQLPGWNFVFPQGHLEVPIGPFMSGRAWFPIDLDRFERSVRTHEYDELMNTVPPGADRAIQHVTKMLAALPFRASQIILGGFSQGAMLTSNIAVQHAEEFRGLVLLSGALMGKPLMTEKAVSKKNLRYFQCHGTGDPILPIATAQALHDLLSDAGLHGEFLEFRGGHEIPMPVIARLRSFLLSLES
jgi:phospholipase/carboxylesterase